MNRDVVVSLQDLVSSGRFSELLLECERLIPDAECAEVHQFLGYASQQTGQYAKAIKACRRANELGLQDWSNHFILGQSFAAIGEHSSACDAFREASRLMPGRFEISFGLFSSICAAEGLEAADAFRRCQSSEFQRRTLLKWENLCDQNKIESIEALVRDGRYDLVPAEIRATPLRPISRAIHRYLEYVDHYRQWEQYRSALKNTVPKLSVLIITYNHERYIADALDSVLMQETQFDIEIIVMEDCSTDGTRDVIMRYVEKYPERIVPVFNPVNIGMLNPPQQKVTHEGFKKLKGDYIAILEGDDYWSSPLKVQTQIDFLENNPRFVAACHNTVKIYENGERPPHRFLYWENMKDTHDVDDMIKLSFFHTSSFVYRNLFQGRPPDFFRSKWSCDIFLNIFFAHHGYIKYFNSDMSVYRAHTGGSYSTLSAMNGAIFNINGLREYNKWLKYRYMHSFAFQISRRCLSLLRDAQTEGRSPISLLTRWKFRAIEFYYRVIFRLLSRFPSLDPAMFWHGEPRG